MLLMCRPFLTSEVHEDIDGLRYEEMFHLFSVFDGHGGQLAAEHCKERLAENLEATLKQTLEKHALPITELVR